MRTEEAPKRSLFVKRFGTCLRNFGSGSWPDPPYSSNMFFGSVFSNMA